MNRSKKIGIAVASGLIIITAVGACSRGYWSHHGNHDPAKKVEWIKEEIEDHLNLTEIQRTELDRLGDRLLAIHSTRKQEQSKRMDLVRELVTAPTIDQARVLELVNEHTRFVDQKAPEVIAAIARFGDSLSVDQKSEISERMNHWMKRHGE